MISLLSKVFIGFYILSTRLRFEPLITKFVVTGMCWPFCDPPRPPKKMPKVVNMAFGPGNSGREFVLWVDEAPKEGEVLKYRA
jgi:hypothetical protein